MSETLNTEPAHASPAVSAAEISPDWTSAAETPKELIDTHTEIIEKPALTSSSNQTMKLTIGAAAPKDSKPEVTQQVTPRGSVHSEAPAHSDAAAAAAATTPTTHPDAHEAREAAPPVRAEATLTSPAASEGASAIPTTTEKQQPPPNQPEAVSNNDDSTSEVKSEFSDNDAKGTYGYYSDRSDSQSDGERSSQDSQGSFLSIQGRSVRDAPRKRRRTTPHELEVLEAEFSRNNRPGKSDRERIAKLTSMDEKAVQVWFQNKRQSHRRQHNLVTPAAVRTQSMPVFQDENSYLHVPPVANVAAATNAAAASVAAAAHPVIYTPFMSARPSPQHSVHLAHPENLAHTLRSTPKFRMGNHVVYGSPPSSKGPKALKLSMSADGKAELIERSPLKQLNPNTNTSSLHSTAPSSFGGHSHHIMPAFSNSYTYPSAPPAAPSPTSALAASRFASMPAYNNAQQPVTGIEQECASSLMVLKFGKWR